MAIFSVYVVNKAGGLIYQLDNQTPRSETEKTFSYPLDFVLKVHDERVLVSFGQRDSIRVGHSVLSINGIDVNGRLFAIGSQLSPEPGSSGIEMLETDTFKLHCYQTLTGIKFMVLSDPRQAGTDTLLRKIYELYSDYALKNPFYSLEMPIRCELFDQNLKSALEIAEKAGTLGPSS
ncbi:PREDICTED: trafficking protein particle complex subunit 4 isoform X3 [Nanorana parkeri]|uniref:trafficking protein particle complex subunit 4 isoform X3 n=1 Tax=Nanorana parkeri TaxID=125878 RepID=UPI0008544A94|nr:PREDICTED: trafficking protein particle complex subunit 4 isoform X3 [Nanorana parkeri]